MNLQVLVSNINQTDYSLLEKMNIQSDAVVVNQCGKDSYEEFDYKGNKIIWICMSKKGVGLSRNTCLFNATADIVLWADDDLTYEEGYSEQIINAFKENKKADVFCFNVELINSCKDLGIHKNNTKIARLHFYNSMRYGACVIAARRKAILRERIAYSLIFGGGAEFSSGEDSLFIRDCLNSKLKIYSHTYLLAKIDDSGSTWYQGHNDKLFKDRGMLLATAFPRIYKLLFVYYAFKMRNLSPNYSFFKIYNLFKEGRVMKEIYR